MNSVGLGTLKNGSFTVYFPAVVVSQFKALNCRVQAKTTQITKLGYCVGAYFSFMKYKYEKVDIFVLLPLVLPFLRLFINVRNASLKKEKKGKHFRLTFATT